MMQMIRQVAAGQAAQVQTGQAGREDSARAADAFPALLRSAAKAGRNEERTADDGGEEKEGRSRENKTGNLLLAQIPSQTVIFPFGAVDAAADPAPSPSVLFDSPAAGQPVPQGDVPAAIPQPAARENGVAFLQSAQGEKAVSFPGAAPAAKPEAGPASAEKTPAREETYTPGSAAARTAPGVPEKSVAAPPERTGFSHSESSGEELPEENPAGKTGGESTQPQKKQEIQGEENRASPVFNLYAGGNVVIKVSDAEAAQRPQAVRQVVQAVAQRADQGKREFQVELYPQSLGRVSVKLSSENGVLTVEISASNPKTQNLLLSGSEDIRSMLQASTGRNVNLVRPEQFGGWYAPRDGGDSGGARQGQEEEKRRESAARRGLRGIGAAGSMDAGDFLSLMRQITQ